MRLRRKEGFLVVSLILSGCVLPDRGGVGSVTQGVDGPSGGANTVGGTGNLTASNPTGQGGNLATGSGATTGGSTGDVRAAGGTVGSGGTCASDASAGAGGCDCSTGGSAAADACSYPRLDGGVCPQTLCAGYCGMPGAKPADDILMVPTQSIFALQIGIPANTSAVALGAVTTTDAAQDQGRPGNFQLGLYDDNNMQPGRLLAYTNQLTADFRGVAVEGLLSSVVSVPKDSSLAYWVLMLNDATSGVILENYYTGDPMERVLFRRSVNCLPGTTSDCPMPTLIPYDPAHITLPNYVIPFLYARYTQ